MRLGEVFWCGGENRPVADGWKQERAGVEMALQDSVSQIKGVGEKTEKLFAKMGIYTKQDLLLHYPRNYDQFGPVQRIADLKEGEVAAVEAAVSGGVAVKPGKFKKITACEVGDGTGIMNLTWFNMPFLRSYLKKGVHYIFRGQVSRKFGSFRMEQPKIYTREEYYKKSRILQPVYPLTAGVTSLTLSKAIRQVLPELTAAMDYLPPTFRKEHDLTGLKAAVEEIHFPKNYETMVEARKRLVFDEFFLFLLSVRRMKEERTASASDYVFSSMEKCERLRESLPYRLTGAQERTWEEMRRDLTSGMRMNRLIQGDVGSGKTILAILALCAAAENGYQGCLMVPTEVLARQHKEELERYFAPLDIRTELLTGSMTAKEKREAYARIAAHEVDIIVGTHALIQDKVQYDNLALVITDEQHRFGVKQREKLSGKGDEPHVCVMSATPIPRTLAIILYGDLDISLVDERPAERLPIKNCVVGTDYRETAYRFIEKEVGKGRQAYVICPMVEESETVEAENVSDYSDRMREALPPYINIGVLHGKMKNDEKNRIMEAFLAGEIQVLVSTTVVEVGVNVPNATVMMIENAERFGLAQLHQLRGRVGRGKEQSYCIFMAGNTAPETMERLEILKNSNDGFHIAEEDLKLRGPGDLFGIRQSGEMSFGLADIYQDAAILKEASDCVRELSEEERDTFYENGKKYYDRAFTYGNEGSVI